MRPLPQRQLTNSHQEVQLQEDLLHFQQVVCDYQFLKIRTHIQEVFPLVLLDRLRLLLLLGAYALLHLQEQLQLHTHIVPQQPPTSSYALQSLQPMATLHAHNRLAAHHSWGIFHSQTILALG